MRMRKTLEDVEQPLAGHVDATLRKIMYRSHQKDKYALYKLHTHWTEIVGDINARHCQPALIARSRLFVNVDGAVWASELTMLKKEILGRIAKLLPAKAVKDIHFHIGTVRRRTKQAAAPPPKRELPPLTDAEKERIRQSLPPIRNEDLRPRISKPPAGRPSWKRCTRPDSSANVRAAGPTWIVRRRCARPASGNTASTRNGPCGRSSGGAPGCAAPKKWAPSCPATKSRSAP